MTALMGIDARMRLAKLYLTTDARVEQGDLAEFLQAAFAGGVDIVQIREKDMATKQLLDVLEVARDVAFPHNGLVCVNDSPEIAHRFQADVLHVGQHDAAPSEARKQVHKWAQIGQSTHDEADIARSLADKAVNYLTVGPVYATSPDPRYAPPGLDLVRTAARLCPPGDPSSKPWFAIGGIEPGTVDEVLAAGARRVAVVGAITQADDPEAAARALARRVRKAWDDDPAMEKVALGAFGGGMSFKTT